MAAGVIAMTAVKICAAAEGTAQAAERLYICSLSHIKSSGALRSHQPLMACEAEHINIHVFYIYRKYTGCLRCIDYK